MKRAKNLVTKNDVMIYQICGNASLQTGVISFSSLSMPALQDTFHWTLGCALFLLGLGVFLLPALCSSWRHGAAMRSVLCVSSLDVPVDLPNVGGIALLDRSCPSFVEPASCSFALDLELVHFCCETSHRPAFRLHLIIDHALILLVVSADISLEASGCVLFLLGSIAFRAVSRCVFYMAVSVGN